MCAVSCHCKFACGCMYEDYKSVNVFHFNRICTYTCINGVRAGGGMLQVCVNARAGVVTVLMADIAQ